MLYIKVQSPEFEFLSQSDATIFNDVLYYTKTTYVLYHVLHEVVSYCAVMQRFICCVTWYILL